MPSNFLVELGLKGSPTETETYVVHPELILEYVCLLKCIMRLGPFCRHNCSFCPHESIDFSYRTSLSNGSGLGGNFDDDLASADPEGAAAVISGVKSILASGASFVSTGVNKLSESFAAAPQLDANSETDAVDGGEEVDPLLGQPVRKAVVAASSCIPDEERAAMEAEERSKSAAYAAVELKSKSQKQM